MMNFNHLYYFFVTAQLKSVTKASIYLSISQPSLSIQLKTLEEVIGFKLFSRKGKRLELTDRGQVTYEFCRRMFQEVDGLENFINKKDNQFNSLNIGSTDQIERPFLSELVGNYLQKLDKNDIPKIRMETVVNEDMINLLSIGKIDLLITTDRIDNKEFEFHKLNIPVALVGKDKNILMIGNTIKSIKQYFKQNEINLITSLESFQLRKETDYYLSKNKCTYKIIFESGNIAAMNRAIAENIGVAFMPIFYSLKDIKNSNLFHYLPNGGIWNHSIYFYYSSAKKDNSYLAEFINTVQNFNKN